MESAIYPSWPVLASSLYRRVTVVPQIPLPCSMPSSVTSFCASTATLTGKVPVPICLHPVSLVTKYCSHGLSVPHRVLTCSNSLILCSGFIVAALPLGVQQESVFLTHRPLFSDQVPWSRFSLSSEWLFSEASSKSPHEATASCSRLAPTFDSRQQFVLPAGTSTQKTELPVGHTEAQIFQLSS